MPEVAEVESRQLPTSGTDEVATSHSEAAGITPSNTATTHAAVPLVTNPTGADHQAAIAAIHTVAVYDPNRDPAKDLQATVAQAKQSGKRILLDIGGDW